MSTSSYAPAPAGAPRSLATAPMPAERWWRVRMMWLVIGGPLLVVVASFITLALALRHPDPVLSTPAAKTKAEQPAVQARNHAATPGR